MAKNDDRPNPEELLQAIENSESKIKKGRLKIYLGMAAGVGKTFSMLEDAQRLAKIGTHVVVGSVETHGRVETAKLLEGLKIVPERWIEYRGTPFRELDIDEILKQSPELVLVDELAHSNIPGSRHPKRWQDVEEILDKGIGVFTTLNIQHVESLKDVVEEISGIQVTETVPDSVIEKATSIELIDLTPLELLQRLEEGKVYLGPQASIAIAHFFQEDKLTALREIAFRFAAEKVDHDLRKMVTSVEREESWRPRERLLILVSKSPKNQKIIRITRRLSFVLNAPWIALHVDDGVELTDTEKTVLGKNLSLARELGAEVISTQDSSLTEALRRVAKQWGITQVILGRGNEAGYWDPFFRRSFVEKVVAECPDLDVHVIRHTGTKGRYWKKFRFHPKNGSPYLLISVLIGLLTAFNILAKDWLHYRAFGFNYLVGILLLSLFFRKGPLIFGSILACLCWYYFFIPPTESGQSSFSEDVPVLILFLLTALFTGILTDRARKNREMLLKREETTEALYEVTRDIATSTGQKQLLEMVSKRLERALKGESKILLKGIDEGRLGVEKIKGDFKDAKELAAIDWVFENGKEAGWSTNTLPLEKSLYLPLKTNKETFGVLIFTPKKNGELEIRDKNFLLTICQLLTNAIEKSFKDEREKKKENIRQTEKVYEAVLDILSEKLTDPFQALRASVGELMKDSETLGKRFIYRIEDTSEKLVHDIENISLMSKLNGGELELVKVPNDIHKLVDHSCQKLKKLLDKHKLKIDIPIEMEHVPCDPQLMQVLVTNLLVNAIQNSEDGTTIEVIGTLSGNTFKLKVGDEGKGIPKEMLETVFQKFTRIPNSSKGGLGLGLSLARQIAEIHGGTLFAENRPNGSGTIFTLTLPLTY